MNCLFTVHLTFQTEELDTLKKDLEDKSHQLQTIRQEIANQSQVSLFTLSSHQL